MDIAYTFNGKPWLYAGPSGWIFISFPKKLAKEIRDNHKSEELGWGRLKTKAKIGKTEWSTSIWFDTKQDTYLLPLKAQVRLKEKIQIDQSIKVTIWI